MSSSKTLMRHARIGNCLSHSALNRIDAIRTRNYKRIEKESKTIYLAGCLFMNSSVSLMSDAIRSLRYAKKLRHSEFQDALGDIVVSAPSLVGSTAAIINSFKKNPEAFSGSIFINSLNGLIKTMNDLYDLSESVIFKSEGKEFFALQDKDLNKWSNDIVDFLESNINIIKSMRQNKNRKMNKLGIDLEKSMSRLSSHLKRIKSTENLMSNAELIGRIASGKLEIINVLA